MTTKTEGQHKGEHVVSLFYGASAGEGGDLSVSSGTYDNGNGVVRDGTVLKSVGGKLVPATGSADTAGDSDEDVVGTAFGDYDTTNAEVPGAYVARLAVVDTNLIVAPGSKTALVAALAKLFIIAR
jgi:hypothetical protein